MKTRLGAFFTTLLIIVFLMPGCGKKTHPQREKDETEIGIQAKAYVDAFNNQDADKLASLFSNDAVFCNFTTRVTLQGRDEIAQYFKKRFQDDKGVKLKIEAGHVKFKENKDAVDTGIAKVMYTAKSNIKSSFKAEYVKQKGIWLLQKVVSVEDLPPPSHFEQLKELTFFVGTWVDQDDDVDMVARFKWYKNKNFLVQTFSLRVVGVKQLVGKQYIGWDPKENKIKSWVFDSDGGFGVSIWTKDSGSWYASTIFTLPDGEVATSTNIYTPVDSNTYTFSSVAREIDGRVFPDIGPFTVVRQK